MGFNFLSENIEVYRIPADILKEQKQKVLLRGVQLVAAGYFPEAKGHNLKRDAIDDTVIIYCTAGKGYFKFEDKTWTVKAGDVLHCYRDIPHRYFADKEDPWSIYWFHLQGREVELILKEAGLGARNPVISPGISPILISVFRELLDVLKQGYHLQNSLYVSALARQILTAEIYLSQKSQTIKEDDGQLKDILKFLSEHVNEEMSIAVMAKHCHLSPSYFIRKFKSKYGYSPIEYFNRLKIQTACGYLSVGDQSIKEIAFKLGFKDPLYFSRLFQKVMGKSPRNFRQTNQF